MTYAKLLLLSGAVVSATLACQAKNEVETKRPVTARDCVTVRDVANDEISWQSTIKISPDGIRVAYLVKSPNLVTNVNDIELHIEPVAANSGMKSKPLLVGDLSEVRWSGDSRHVVLLMKVGNRRVVAMVGTRSGYRRVLIKSATDIVEYSMDAMVKTIVYATEVPDVASDGHPTEEESARGYRIPFPIQTETSWPRRQVFVTHRVGGDWSRPTLISIDSPLSGRRLSMFNHAANSGLSLSVAPNGSAVLIGFLDFSNEMPKQWRESAFVKLRDSSGMLRALQPLVRYDLKTGKSSMPLKTPWMASTPMWSSDSKSFAVAALAPVGSPLEENDAVNHALGHVSQSRLFVVDPRNEKFEVVVPHLAFPWEGPLFWASTGELFLRGAAMNKIATVIRQDGVWREATSITLPLEGDLQVTTNGSYVVGAFSDAHTSPELFEYQTDEKKLRVLAHLNPQLDNLTLARSKQVHWKTSKGFDVTGILLLPPNFVEGTRYPLVIQTKPFAEGFPCSFGNFPSFAPQPIANSGIIYVGRVNTEGSQQKEEDYFPDGYPGPKGAGSLGEAAFNMDIWDSGVKELDHLGFIDATKVGIIGFSRTGWYTEFILAHSSIRYRAATVADNVQYSVGEYWLRHDRETIEEYNHLYGGSPYGPSSKNWLDYSISFNLDKIHTPLLMEEMGHGKSYDGASVVPIDLASAFEVFTGLSVLRRPVELFYYPAEEHAPDHPIARLNTLQRNVDWYRFWLQGYERPNPEDKDQYPRWRKLCSELQSCAN